MGYRRDLALAAALACILAASVPAAAAQVEIVTDLLAAPRSRTTDCIDVSLRAAASSGNVLMPALFHHPALPGRPGRVEYQLDLPAAGPGEKLLFAFNVALSDGVRFDVPGTTVDGVRFGVEVNGRPVFSQSWREMRWCPGGVDLTPYAGARVRLALLVDPLATVSYDWAQWGSPRILLFHGADTVAPRVGTLALACRPGVATQIRITPAGQGEPVTWMVPKAEGDTPRWATFEWAFPDARSVSVAITPPAPNGATWMAAYAPRLRLLRVGPARAVVIGGRPCGIRVAVRNEGRGMLEAGRAQVVGSVCGRPLPTMAVPEMAPGKTWRGEWPWDAPLVPGTVRCGARIGGSTTACTFATFAGPTRANSLVLANRQVRLEFVRAAGGYAYGRVMAPGARAGSWWQAATWYPLGRVSAQCAGGKWQADVRFTGARRTREGLSLAGSLRDRDGVRWSVALEVRLRSGRAAATVRYRYATPGPRRLCSAWGPNLYVGDGTTGDAKHWALLPGVDHLYAGEVSSSERDLLAPVADRRTPDPRKLTMPLMAVSVGPRALPPPAYPARFYCPDSRKDQPAVFAADGDRMATVALQWDPMRKWDGARAMPSCRFASPNLDEGMHNHRMGLFVPSVPEHVDENADGAARPYRLAAGKAVSLEADLVVRPGPVLGVVGDWLRGSRGVVAAAKPWPRTFEQEMAICRQGLLETVWDSSTGKWRHCIGYQPMHSPGLAALLWIDAHTSSDPRARASAQRVATVTEAMRKDQGAGSLFAAWNCHILRWEFPFLAGHLAEAMPALDAEAVGMASGQRPGGGWLFNPGAPEQRDLGEPGDTVLGTSAYNTYLLARFARITGDASITDSAARGLRFMERFRVPRGAGTWECPMYEPDLLAAGYAIGAYVEGYRATGDRRWLQDAVYWAESGLPFLYHWSVPDRPMMLGATTSNIGSTFYYHSWIGMPVQWVGLVFAYHVQHLAGELAQLKGPAGGTSSPLRPAVNLTPDEWRRIAAQVTVSGMHQQYTSGARVGTYPDSITDFSRQNAPYLNPEDVLVNVLALKGMDLDVHSARIRTAAGEVVVSSGAVVEGLRLVGRQLRFRLRGFAGERSHALVSGITPGSVRADGIGVAQTTPESGTGSGWSYDPVRRRLFVTVRQTGKAADVAIDLGSAK